MQHYKAGNGPGDLEAWTAVLHDVANFIFWWNISFTTWGLVWYAIIGYKLSQVSCVVSSTFVSKDSWGKMHETCYSHAAPLMFVSLLQIWYTSGMQSILGQVWAPGILLRIWWEWVDHAAFAVAWPLSVLLAQNWVNHAFTACIAAFVQQSERHVWPYLLRLTAPPIVQLTLIDDNVSLVLVSFGASFLSDL